MSARRHLGIVLLVGLTTFGLIFLCLKAAPARDPDRSYGPAAIQTFHLLAADDFDALDGKLAADVDRPAMMRHLREVRATLPGGQPDSVRIDPSTISDTWAGRETRMVKLICTYDVGTSYVVTVDLSRRVRPGASALDRPEPIGPWEVRNVTNHSAPWPQPPAQASSGARPAIQERAP